MGKDNPTQREVVPLDDFSPVNAARIHKYLLAQIARHNPADKQSMGDWQPLFDIFIRTGLYH
jgi:hypothetical protein